MKLAYRKKVFKTQTAALVRDMDRIVTDYQAQGLSLTLRQLYYRLVASNIVPNTPESYFRVGRVLSDARLAGLIDWDAIVDRERALSGWETWDSLGDFLASMAYSLRYDHWNRQQDVAEVWVEKKALIGVITRACAGFRVSHFACKGYVSQSALYQAAKRIGRRAKRGQTTTILYLGDHDPSGIDMPRDISERLDLFRVGSAATVKRIALSREQIAEHGPPPNPAKVTDARFKKYKNEFGVESWELDALEPRALVQLVEGEVRSIADESLLEATLEAEDRDSRWLKSLADSMRRGDRPTFCDTSRLAELLRSMVEDGRMSQEASSALLSRVAEDSL